MGQVHVRGINVVVVVVVPLGSALVVYSVGPNGNALIIYLLREIDPSVLENFNKETVYKKHAQSTA